MLVPRPCGVGRGATHAGRGRLPSGCRATAWHCARSARTGRGAQQRTPDALTAGRPSWRASLRPHECTRPPRVRPSEWYRPAATAANCSPPAPVPATCAPVAVRVDCRIIPPRERHGKNDICLAAGGMHERLCHQRVRSAHLAQAMQLLHSSAWWTDVCMRYAVAAAHCLRHASGTLSVEAVVPEGIGRAACAGWAAALARGPPSWPLAARGALPPPPPPMLPLRPQLHRRPSASTASECPAAATPTMEAGRPVTLAG